MLEKEVDQLAIKQCLEHHLPQVLSYVEEQLPEQGYVAEHFSMAEISLWSVFRSGWMAGLRLTHYPKLQAYLTNIEQEPWIANLISEEDHELSSFYCEPMIFDNHVG